MRGLGGCEPRRGGAGRPAGRSGARAAAHHQRAIELHALHRRRALLAECRAAGHPVPWYAACDVRDVAAYQAVLARAAHELGPIRVLVNNAGRDDRHAMEEVTPEFWDDRLALNLRHYFFAIQAVAPGMAAAGGGSVVNMGSVSTRPRCTATPPPTRPSWTRSA